LIRTVVRWWFPTATGEIDNKSGTIVAGNKRRAACEGIKRVTRTLSLTSRRVKYSTKAQPVCSLNNWEQRADDRHASEAGLED
jgi:hypothetical protein